MLRLILNTIRARVNFNQVDKFFILIFFTTILLRAFYVFAVPPGQNPDEIYIFERILTISSRISHSGPPDGHTIYYANNEYIYPPLYFGIAAFILSLWTNFDITYSSLQDNFLNYYLLLRIFNFSMSVFSLFLIWRIIKKFELNSYITLSIFAVISLLPTFLVFSSSSNHNNLLFFFVILFIYLVVQSLDKLQEVKQYALLGSIVGFASLTKQDGLILLFVFPIFTLFIRKTKNIFLFLPFVISAFFAGLWWYAFNIINTGWFYERRLFEASIQNFVRPFSFEGYLVELAKSSIETFFVAYGSQNHIRLGFSFYLVLMLLFISGVAVFLKNQLFTLLRSIKFRQIYLLLFIILVFNFIVFFYWNLFHAYQAQGRYFFNSLIFIVTNVTIGLSSLLGKKNFEKFLGTVIAALLIINVLSINCMLSAFYQIKIIPNLFGCLDYLVFASY